MDTGLGAALAFRRLNDILWIVYFTHNWKPTMRQIPPETIDKLRTARMRARKDDPDTSFSQAGELAATRIFLVLREIVRADAIGATSHEVADAIQKPLQNVSPAFAILKDLGLIEDSGFRRRALDTGHLRIVWINQGVAIDRSQPGLIEGARTHARRGSFGWKMLLDSAIAYRNGDRAEGDRHFERYQKLNPGFSEAQ